MDHIKGIKILSVLVIFSCMVMTANIFCSAMYAHAQTPEEMEREPRPLPGGWINSISDDAVIINDTHYLIARETRYPKGKDMLVEGEFVRYRLQKENVLAEIFPGKPRRDEMFMKPIVRTERKTPSETEQESASPAAEGGSENGGMRLENGVWVN